MSSQSSQADKLLALVKEMGSSRRVEHAKRCREMALTLSEQWSGNRERAEMAALGHDLAREMKREEIESLALQDGLPIYEIEREAPLLLHGRAAAALIIDKIGIVDEDTINGIRYHTTGRGGMTLTEKIVFVADKIERGREYLTEEQRERYIKQPYNLTVLQIGESLANYCIQKRSPIHPLLSELIRELKSKRV